MWRILQEMVSWDDFYSFHFTVQNHLKDIQLAFELTGAEEITEGRLLSLSCSMKLSTNDGCS